MELYKGRYLIAVYDKDDYLIDVACSVKELKCPTKKSSVYSSISRNVHHKSPTHKYYLIDCLEKHNDIFAEEDRIFLESLPPKKQTLKEIAKEMGVSERTLYRKKKLLGREI